MKIIENLIALFKKAEEFVRDNPIKSFLISLGFTAIIISLWFLTIVMNFAHNMSSWPTDIFIK